MAFQGDADVDFLNNLLDQLIEDYPVDPQRVYIYGYSSGAAMAHRMACANAERFAGIVAGAGAILDETVLFDGGNIGHFAGADPGNPACIYPSAVGLLTQWANRNGCGGELKFGNKPKYDLTTPGYADSPGIGGGVEGKDTTVHKFQQCPDGIDVELWEMAAGIPHPPFFYHFGANGIKVLAEKSWKFLRSHKRSNGED